MLNLKTVDSETVVDVIIVAVGDHEDFLLERIFEKIFETVPVLMWEGGSVH